MELRLLYFSCVVWVAPSATSWSLGQRSPAGCVCVCVCACTCVSNCVWFSNPKTRQPNSELGRSGRERDKHRFCDVLKDGRNVTLYCIDQCPLYGSVLCNIDHVSAVTVLPSSVCLSLKWNHQATKLSNTVAFHWNRSTGSFLLCLFL
jgi:hypothetical protein